MANLLNKDPFTYDEERRSFLQDLQRFHQTRGTPYDRIPQIGGREVDLYRLYRRVIELGGFQKVNNEEKWEDIQGEFSVPRSCTNGAQALKFVYVRYLHIYEKIHFLGQDPDRNDDDDGHPARKKLCAPTFGVPLTYNYHQHQLTDAVRQTYNLSQDLLKLTDYDKLEKALLSGLPNEVDFVVNVCTLLSNESRHVLTLKKSHQLVDLLLAHIGIFSDDTCYLEDLYKCGWTKYSKKDYLRFWYESVSDESTRELILTNGASYERDEKCGSEVLNLKRDLGIHDKEGQRVTQLAVLFRNLSFEQANQEYLAEHSVVFRFLMLCIHSSYGTLAQLALDTMGNIASKIKLKKMSACNSKALLDLITKGLHSPDKFFVVRALEILGKLCQLEENEVIVSDRLQSSTYEDVCRLLTIHDIQLIVHTLETLYQLSELGEQTTTRIAAVKSAVDMLIGLITVEAQSYGPNSLIGIKVVEYVPPPDTTKKVPERDGSSVSIVMQPPGTPVSKSSTAAHSTPPRPLHPTPDVKTNTCSDNESTTCNWLQATYETRRSGKVLQLDLLAEYLQFCRKYSVPEVLSSTDFLHLVKVVFPQAELTSKEKPNGEKEICFIGLSKRANAKPFAITHSVPKSRSVTVNSLHGSSSANTPQVDLTQTPTLRQRLMEPPRIAIHQQLVNAGPGAALAGKKEGGKTPSKSKSKAQQQQQQQQQATAGKAPTTTATSHILGAATVTGTVSITNLPAIKPKSVLQQQLQTPLSGKSSPKPVEATLAPQGLVPGVAQSPQSFPTIHNALQADGKSVSSFAELPLEVLQKSSDTNLIKSLLARKLSQNMVGRHPLPIPSQILQEAGSSTTDLQGQSLQTTTDTFGQHQQFDSPSAPEVVTHHHEFEQHNNHDPSSPQPQSESPQPTSVHQVPLAPASPAAQQPMLSSQSPMTPPTNSKTAKSKKGPSSPRPASPKAKSQPQSASSPGSRPCSPRSPRSQAAYELEVCGEVERAKDIVRSGAEAFIERVENRNLQQWQKVQKSLPKPSAILMPPESIDSKAAELNTVSSDQSELNSTRAVDKDFVSSSSSVVMDPNQSIGVTDTQPIQKEVISKSEFVQNNQTLLSDKADSDTTAESAQIGDRVGNHCKVEGTAAKNNEATMDMCSGVNEITLPLPVMNGSLSSPSIPDSDMPPSPLTTHKENQDRILVNGVSEGKDNTIDDSVQKTLAKDQLLKIVEKTGKMNGIVNHVGNGDHVREEEAMEVGGGDVSVQSRVGGGDDQRVPLPGEQVRLQSLAGHGDSKSQGVNGNSAYIPGSDIASTTHPTVNVNNTCVSVTVTKTEPDISLQMNIDQKPEVDKLCKQSHEKLEIPMEKMEQKFCDTRHVPTPETSRDSELSSDSFASSTAESVGEKHSTIIMTSGVGLIVKDTAPKVVASVTATIPIVPAVPTAIVMTSSAAVSAKSTGKPKPRKRSRSNTSNTSTSSQESRSSVVMLSLTPEYMCEWNSCKKCFDSARSVFIHVSKTHVLADTNGFCQWLGCEQLKRKRWSLVTHCQDHHCSEHALRAAHQRRVTAAQTGKPSPAITTPTTMVYPNDAAMQAIKRFTPKPPFPEFSEPREGPVTKHIRLTAALILRNLARYSALGRSLIKKKERHLSYQTMSAVESSNALANCLWEILHDT